MSILQKETFVKAHKKRDEASKATSLILSGWQDSNLRPPAPKAGAMTGLRYTPKICAERLGLEPRQHLRADRLAICSVTTPAPLQSDLTFGIKVGAKILFKVDSNKKKREKFHYSGYSTRTW